MTPPTVTDPAEKFERRRPLPPLLRLAQLAALLALDEVRTCRARVCAEGWKMLTGARDEGGGEGEGRRGTIDERLIDDVAVFLRVLGWASVFSA